MNVLLVEDDLVLGKSLQRGLNEAGWDCIWVTTGNEAIREVQDTVFPLVVLDLMLPDIEGLALLGKFKEASPSPSVLILTARGSVDERVQGLQAGADDYLVKPFAFAELLARMAVICRRSVAPLCTEIRIGPVTLNIVSRSVVREEKSIDLTPTEFSLLEFLMRHAGHPVSRRMLCEHLWDADWEGVTNVIEVHINRLRAKIDRGFERPLIETVRGLGYAFRTP